MAEFTNLILTGEGQKLLADVIGSGRKITFTSVITTEEKLTADMIKNLNGFENTVQSVTPSSVTVNGSTVRISVLFSNTGLDKGYFIRTIGVMAKADNGKEILYGAAAEQTGACYMPPDSGALAAGANIQILTAIDDAENITVTTNNIGTALQRDLDELNSTKVDKETGKGLSSNDFTDTYKSKLEGIAEGADKITVDTALSGSSTNPVQNKAVYTALNGKVDRVSGKGLSTNDYTTDEKNKLAGISEGANKTIVDNDISFTSTNPLQNKIITASMTALSNRIGTVESGLSTVNNDISGIETQLETLNVTTADLDNLKVDKISGKGLSTNDYTTTEKTKLNGIESGAQVNTITGVKGNSESSYRTGNVNLTAANIGAAASSHTHYYAGSSSIGGSADSAVKLATARAINGISFDGTSDIDLPVGTRWSVSGGSVGYYKFLSKNMSGSGDFNIMLAISNNRTSSCYGIFAIHISCDSSNVYAPNRFGWLTRVGFEAGQIKAVLIGRTMDFYINQPTAITSGSLTFTVMHRWGSGTIDDSFTPVSSTTTTTGFTVKANSADIGQAGTLSIAAQEVIGTFTNASGVAGAQTITVTKSLSGIRLIDVECVTQHYGRVHYIVPVSILYNGGSYGGTYMSDLPGSVSTAWGHSKFRVTAVSATSIKVELDVGTNTEKQTGITITKIY